MNFTSKLTLAIATAVTLLPVAVNANPVVSAGGSTAAAVSIKFQNHNGSTSGNFSINPGANASGGGTGVKELSAAVATGETSANADSASTGHGTSATAHGYSAPVSFKYITTSDVNNKDKRSEYVYSSEYKEQAAIEFAAAQKNVQFVSASASEQVELLKKGHYHNGEYIKYTSSEMSALEAASTSDASLSLKADGKASALSTGSGKESAVVNGNARTTNYEYQGTSAGLQFIPAMPK